MIIRDLLEKKNPTKKEKLIIKDFQHLLRLIDESKIDFFTNYNYKSLNDFILDSIIYLDTSDFKKESNKLAYQERLNCLNFDEFYKGYGENISCYKKHTNLTDEEIESKKNIIKEKMAKDAEGYEELTDYFIFMLYQHINLLEKAANLPQHLPQTIKYILQEWYSQESINGTYLLIDIHRDHNLKTAFGAFFDYIETNKKEKSLEIDSNTLHDRLLNILESLDNQKRKLLIYNNKVEMGKEIVYESNRYFISHFDTVQEKCLINISNLEKVYTKAPNNAEKLLQLFLHEYAFYILTSVKREQLNINYHNWNDFYNTKILTDGEVTYLLDVLNTYKGTMSQLTLPKEGFADLFSLYYYNIFRNGMDSFKELNEDKEFLPELLTYFGQNKEANND